MSTAPEPEQTEAIALVETKPINPQQMVVTDPTTLFRIAKSLAASGYFSGVRNAEQAFAKLLYGAEIGIGPMSAIAGVHIVDGKPTLDASLVGARIKQSGRYDYRVIESTEKGCTLEFFERGESVGRSTFDEKDAQRAGLAGKQNWKTYPRAMYRARAMTQGAPILAPTSSTGPSTRPTRSRPTRLLFRRQRSLLRRR